MKKILISIFILLSTSLVFSEEVTPIYEYRNEALRNIDAKMDAERDRGRLKKLHNHFEKGKSADFRYRICKWKCRNNLSVGKSIF